MLNRAVAAVAVKELVLFHLDTNPSVTDSLNVNYLLRPLCDDTPTACATTLSAL